MQSSRQIHLVRRPNGVPVPEDFAVVEVETADAGDGQVQVQNLLMSVDPYMRPRLTADQPLGVAMIGGGIGRVVQCATRVSGKATWCATAPGCRSGSYPTARACRC
jgi:NADPH-dependent curcumin reductase CurA